MSNPVYSHPIVYHAAMRVLYRNEYEQRMERIAALIPEGSIVLELCCGNARLYTHYLKAKNVDYIGVDNNLTFVNQAQMRGVKVICADVENINLPRADYIIMQASLYQFIDNADSLIKRWYGHCSKGLIISEPVKNLSQTNSPLRSLGMWLSSYRGIQFEKRFDNNQLQSLFKELNIPFEIKFHPGMRESILLAYKS